MKNLLLAVAITALTSSANAQQPARADAPDANATSSPRDGYRDVHVIVSLEQRMLWVIGDGDTLREASVAVASGREFEYAGQRWRFDTPRGKLVVRGKKEDPIWMPPDWHYAEVARSNDLRIRRLPASGVRLRDGRRLVMRDSVVGVEFPGDTTFAALPIDEHIVFDSTLFIPPIESKNRRLVGELGRYALDLGNGYLLHGTRDAASIGTATTHGCIRLSDDDLAWLYEHVPVGASVYVR